MATLHATGCQHATPSTLVRQLVSLMRHVWCAFNRVAPTDAKRDGRCLSDDRCLSALTTAAAAFVASASLAAASARALAVRTIAARTASLRSAAIRSASKMAAASSAAAFFLASLFF